MENAPAAFSDSRGEPRNPSTLFVVVRLIPKLFTRVSANVGGMAASTQIDSKFCPLGVFSCLKTPDRSISFMKTLSGGAGVVSDGVV